MIDLEKTDSFFSKEIQGMKGGEKISACFTCRSCSASCPITAVDKRFNPVKIIRKALFGMRDEVLGSEFIWLCSNCYACQERCPQGVKITDFMVLLKNLAVKDGHVPQGVKAQEVLIMENGRIYPLDDFDNKKRKKMGLPQLPTECDILKKIFQEGSYA